MHIIVMPICNIGIPIMSLWVLAQAGSPSCAQTVQQFSLGTYIRRCIQNTYIYYYTCKQSVPSGNLPIAYSADIIYTYILTNPLMLLTSVHAYM